MSLILRFFTFSIIWQIPRKNDQRKRGTRERGGNAQEGRRRRRRWHLGVVVVPSLRCVPSFHVAYWQLCIATDAYPLAYLFLDLHTHFFFFVSSLASCIHTRWRLFFLYQVSFSLSPSCMTEIFIRTCDSLYKRMRLYSCFFPWFFRPLFQGGFERRYQLRFEM